MAQEYSDREWRTAFRHEEKFFHEVFKECENALYFYAFKKANDKAETTSMVSEAYYALWKNREKINDRLHVRSYLYTVVRNAWYDRGLEKERLREEEYRHTVYRDLHEQDLEPDDSTDYEILYAELMAGIDGTPFNTSTY